MLAEAAVEQDAAVLPPQYQTNYREEYQYSGIHTGQYVLDLNAVSVCVRTPKLQSTAMHVGGTVNPVFVSHLQQGVYNRLVLTLWHTACLTAEQEGHRDAAANIAL